MLITLTVGVCSPDYRSLLIYFRGVVISIMVQKVSYGVNCGFLENRKLIPDRQCKQILEVSIIMMSNGLLICNQ